MFLSEPSSEWLWNQENKSCSAFRKFTNCIFCWFSEALLKIEVKKAYVYFISFTFRCSLTLEVYKLPSGSLLLNFRYFNFYSKSNSLQKTIHLWRHISSIALLLSSKRVLLMEDKLFSLQKWQKICLISFKFISEVWRCCLDLHFFTLRSFFQKLSLSTKDLGSYSIDKKFLFIFIGWVSFSGFLEEKSRVFFLSKPNQPLLIVFISQLTNQDSSLRLLMANSFSFLSLLQLCSLELFTTLCQGIFSDYLYPLALCCTFSLSFLWVSSRGILYDCFYTSEGVCFGLVYSVITG